MNSINIALNLFSSITRSIPYFRGLGTIYRMFNLILIKFCSNPIVNCNMKDGTTMRIDLRTNTDIDAYYRGIYDDELITVVRSILNPDSIFIDVGANIGFYTISIAAWIKSKNGSGQVIAFEPFDGNYQRLIENIKLNNLENSITTHKIGLSNESAESLITLREDFLYGSGTGNAAIPTDEVFDAGFKTAPIHLEKLDKIFDDLYSDKIGIDFIKIDIEGHEDFCLQGGYNTIQEYRPTILMEVNKPYYIARKVKLDDIFNPLLPSEYLLYKKFGNQWKTISSLNECGTIDNVFLIPKEKITLDHYKIFIS